MENVQHPDHTIKSKIQKVYRPFWRGFTLRCKAGTFDARREIEEAGYRIECQEMTVKSLPAMLSRFVFGTACKSD